MTAYEPNRNLDWPSSNPSFGEPVYIECEGQGCPPNLPAVNGVTGLCAMCGQSVLLAFNGTVQHHYRKDILAMLARGDFG